MELFSQPPGKVLLQMDGNATYQELDWEPAGEMRKANRPCGLCGVRSDRDNAPLLPMARHHNHYNQAGDCGPYQIDRS
jgi:hypothetical protein